MIKKTFETIKQDPIIVLFFAILFVLTMFSKTLSSLMIYRLAESSENALNIFIYGNIIKFYDFIISVLQGVYIFMPVSYYTFLVYTGNYQKRWYKGAIWRNWRRALVFWFIVYIIIILNIMFMIKVGTTYHIGTLGTISWHTIMYWIIGFIVYLVTAPIIAEDSIKQGLRNIFAVGKKYFIRLLVVYLISQMVLFLLPSDPALLLTRPLAVILGAIVFSLVCIFMHSYTMNLYLSKR